MNLDREANNGKRKRGERRRASLACETCRKQKEKCEGGPPCWRCQRLGRSCQFQGQPTPRTTSPCSSAPVASVPKDDNRRIESLEYIARHFLGDVPLDEENACRIADKLRSSTNTTLPEIALDINESFDVQFVSNNVAHYAGEFSHWTFSQKLRRRMSCEIGQFDSRVCISPRKISSVSDDLQQVREYWRPTQLQSSPDIILETMTHLPPRPIADFLITMFFKYVEINSFYMERKWIEEKVALCYSSTTTYTAIDFPWVCSVFAALAIGTQVAHMEDEKPKHDVDVTEELNLCSEDSVGLTFYHAACKLIPDVLLVASQESVQVFLLLATYSLPVSTGGLAYTYYGLAMKMAIQNGMHRKYQGGNCNPRTIEVRNRLFWTVYTVEKYISVLHGRPMSIARSEINADMPKDCSTFESPRFANLVAFHKLISYLGEISETLAQFKRCPKRLLSDYLERLLQLRASIKQWWDSLPATEECRDLCSQGPNFRPNSHLRLCYLLIYVYMGRAFIFVGDRKESSEAIIGADHDSGRARRSVLVDDCVSSALDILNTLQSLSDHVGLCRASYNEFGACRAAILVILAESLSSGKSQRLQDGLHRGMGLIRQMVGGSSSKSEISYLESIEAAVSQLLAVTEEDSLSHPRSPQSDQSSISAYSKFKDWTQSLKKDKSACGNVELSSFSPLSHLIPGTESFANPELNDMTAFFDPDWSNGDFEFDTV
ncbi:transcriptional regulator family: Fungal Specific TF [Penicillium robsamsonii]|uniref:transcriptional regulator family: Fungal Specific TF n=1 Tax=Penicillium robsamsonii TaxID=1792511 RepID=UPI0025481A10|nr:transcriptional regulator family: Fungal Specific TF [Penicillium robsamsonii]KAJ5822438.1 transcriptional regulator family: Fungal Specific TF [Penicillium robsamsonii]